MEIPRKRPTATARNLREAINAEDLLADFSMVIQRVTTGCWPLRSFQADENAPLSSSPPSLSSSLVFGEIPKGLRDNLAKGMYIRGGIVDDIR